LKKKRVDKGASAKFERNKISQPLGVKKNANERKTTVRERKTN
jgi:hypothetical protein